MDANVAEWNEPISYKKIREVRPGSYGILQVLTIDYKKRVGFIHLREISKYDYDWR